MVVDDDEPVREAIAEVLADDGYDVRVACDGDEAITVLREVPRPCVALVDMIMPRIDGWQLVRTINADPSLRDIAIICSSAGREEPPDGCVGVLRKPFDHASLNEAVRAAFATLKR
ncbi:MAG: response regulator [Myxococcales bacterium]|nr:response regulator [Myxococcales bacterium]